MHVWVRFQLARIDSSPVAVAKLYGELDDLQKKICHTCRTKFVPGTASAIADLSSSSNLGSFGGGSGLVSISGSVPQGQCHSGA